MSAYITYMKKVRDLYSGDGEVFLDGKWARVVEVTILRHGGRESVEFQCAWGIYRMYDRPDERVRYRRLRNAPG